MLVHGMHIMEYVDNVNRAHKLINIMRFEVILDGKSYIRYIIFYLHYLLWGFTWQEVRLSLVLSQINQNKSQEHKTWPTQINTIFRFCLTATLLVVNHCAIDGLLSSTVKKSNIVYKNRKYAYLELGYKNTKVKAN